MRIELLQLPKNSKQPPADRWRRFFDFGSVTNNPHCFYDVPIEGRFARLGAWDEAKAAVLMALGSELLPGRVTVHDLQMVAEGRQSDNVLRSLGLAIHSGTTRSIQRALVVALDKARKCTNSSYPTLLTTDFEYPGIVTAIDEIWDGPVFVARLKSLLYEESGKVPDLFKRAVRFVRPDVIYISHVDRYTGFVFPWDLLTKIAGKGDRPPIVVIDGAQAAGNIDLKAHFQLKADEGPHLYATSAHKFLCALPTLGLLIALRKDVEEWELEDKAVAYSLGQGARGTGSIESMVSLARSAYCVLSDAQSARDTFLRGLANGPWTVVQHSDEHRSGLFQISTRNARVALRLERLLKRKTERVGYHISSASEKEHVLARGIRRRNERIFLDIHDRNWRTAEKWGEDVMLVTEAIDTPESYRVSIHPALHSDEDVERLCAFLNDPRSWRDRAFTAFEQLLADRLDSQADVWRKLVRHNVDFLRKERFPEGPWGASYHATCHQLILREEFGSSGRDREWGQGGIANTYYALRGLRPYFEDVAPLETKLAENWSGRFGPLMGIVGVRSSTSPGYLPERLRHACFAYLASIESEEHVEPSPLRPVKLRQENAIRDRIRRLSAKPEEELFTGDDWPFGGLCVLHRVLRDLDPESRAEDLVMERLRGQLVAGAAGIVPAGNTPAELGPIFLSSVHAFSTLVDGRILDGLVLRDDVAGAIRSLCQHVRSLMTPYPRFTSQGPMSMSAAFAGLTFFMWPWLEEVWDENKAPADVLGAVRDLIAWIEDNSENRDAYDDVWSEFHGSFLALDVVQDRCRDLELDEQLTPASGDVLTAIRQHCEKGRPRDIVTYDPLKHPAIFEPAVILDER